MLQTRSRSGFRRVLPEQPQDHVGVEVLEEGPVIVGEVLGHGVLEGRIPQEGSSELSEIEVSAVRVRADPVEVDNPQRVVEGVEADRQLGVVVGYPVDPLLVCPAAPLQTEAEQLEARNDVAQLAHVGGLSLHDVIRVVVIRLLEGGRAEQGRVVGEEVVLAPVHFEPAEAQRNHRAHARHSPAQRPGWPGRPVRRRRAARAGCWLPRCGYGIVSRGSIAGQGVGDGERRSHRIDRRAVNTPKPAAATA